VAEIYQKGWNRIVYRSTNFKEGLNCSVDLYDPSLDFVDHLELHEVSGGLYFFDFLFNFTGTWIGVFFEGGQRTTSKAFGVDRRRNSNGESLINL